MRNLSTPGGLRSSLEALVGGLRKVLPEINQITTGGKTTDIPTLVQEAEEMLAVFQKPVELAALLKVALQLRNDRGPAILARYEEIAAALKGALGKKNPLLVEVGLTPDKTRAPRTVEQKKVAIAKGEATRKARGTMGKRAKAAIHGAETTEKAGS